MFGGAVGRFLWDGQQREILRQDFETLPLCRNSSRTFPVRKDRQQKRKVVESTMRLMPFCLITRFDHLF